MIATEKDIGKLAIILPDNRWFKIVAVDPKTQDVTIEDIDEIDGKLRDIRVVTNDVDIDDIVDL